MSDDDYEGREQALVKHSILRGYLQRLAFKVGGFRPGTTLNYIDGFSGPWDAVKDDHGDSSPAIAMRELARARTSLAELPTPKALHVRCMFVEKDRAAFARLTALCEKAPVEATPIRGAFEDHIPEALEFARRGSSPFAFVFIDPKGWTGFPLRTIAPLLRVTPGEVLINFMLKDILRFIDDGTSVALESFEDLFGQSSSDYRAKWRGLAGLDREDAIVAAYCERIREVGGFRYCVSTVIVNPTVDRTHYHLVFATRSRAGLTTFREIERSVMPRQQEARAHAKQRKSEAKDGQLGLLTASAMDSGYFDSLIQRYRGRARAAIEAALPPVGAELPYDDLVDVALAWPMTTETKLKTWLKEWSTGGRVGIVGLGPRERVPKLGEKHSVRRLR